MEDIVTFIRGFGKDYRDATMTLQHLAPRASVKWSPPPRGWVKINVDAGHKVSQQLASSGFIAKDENGQVLGSGHCMHYLVGSIALVESLALLQGIRFASEMGFTQVLMESDSRLAINHVLKEDNSDSRAVTWDILSWARQFRRCHFEFVTRTGNSAAYAMAVKGLRRCEDCFWVEEVPAGVQAFVDSDRRFEHPP